MLQLLSYVLIQELSVSSSQFYVEAFAFLTNTER